MGQRELVKSFKDSVLEIRINRPKQRNSLTGAMVKALTSLFVEADQDPAVRAIVLRGNGGIFCSGADLGEIDLGASDEAGQAAVTMSRNFAHMCATISECRVPTVTVVEGAAIGGGFGVACSSDLCLATPTATLGFGAQRIGAVPGPIVPFVLDRTGYSTAKLLAVTGSMLDAETALSKGIVHAVEADVDGLLNRQLDAIFECGPLAVRNTKHMVIEANREKRDTMIERACILFGEVVTGDEALEGLDAFREKRTPSWRGRRAK